MSTSPIPTFRRLRAAAVLLALLSLVRAAPAAGQVVEGRLVDAEGDEPLHGAMIALVDASGQAVANTLTDAVGRFTLRAPAAGEYTLRANRIGFASAHSETLHLEAGETVTHRMETRFEPVALEGIAVEGEKRCEVRPEEGAATARVWDQARTALEAAAWTNEKKGYSYRLLSLNRRLGPEAREVRSEQRRRVSGFARNPITSRPAEELIERGFARQLQDGDWMYYAPDARVLLSDPFLDTHCMEIRRGEDERSGLLGLAFRPVEGRRTPDISGTLWLDPASAELQRLDFQYVNIERLLEDVSLNDHVGGEVLFRGLPNGAWIVREWRIRMPLIAKQGRPGRYGRATTLAGLHEIGGLVQEVRQPGGETVFAAEMGILAGAVVDSTGSEPLEGATVRVLGTELEARTDGEGRFRITGLQDGTYRVGYTHPMLHSVGFQPDPREVEVARGSVASVRFQAPSRGEALARACRDEWEDELPDEVQVGTAFGFVLERDGGRPVQGARVQLFWSEWGFDALVEESTTGEQKVKNYQISENRWGAEARTDERGFYAVCGVPAQQPVKAVATLGPVDSDTTNFEVEGAYSQQNLELPVSSTASVSGRVVDFEAGDPIAGARVALPGTGLETTTDSVGRFSVEGVDYGRHAIRVEHGGWSAADTVDVSSGGRVRVDIRVPTDAIEVEGITVEVLSSEERRGRARGFAEDYAGPEEMATIADKVFDMADALRAMGSPRINVTEYGGNVGTGFCLESTRPSSPADLMRSGSANSCQPMLVVVDGQILQDISGAADRDFSALYSLSTARLQDLNLDDIASVRVLTPTQARFRWGSRGDNGAVIVETRSAPR